MITIVDYGVGNLASIQNMFKKVGVTAIISSNESEIASASKLVLPGVGAFDTCANRLEHSGLKRLLDELVLVRQIPVLGVCVGMQLLMSGSEEGNLPGLGWVAGKVVKFKANAMSVGTKIPHMGWTNVTAAKDSPILAGLEDPRFYFVHSFHVELDNPSDALLYANYGYSFVAALAHRNILGVQFHPEKSHRFGMQLFRNFSFFDTLVSR